MKLDDPRRCVLALREIEAALFRERTEHARHSAAHRAYTHEMYTCRALIALITAMYPETMVLFSADGVA